MAGGVTATVTLATNTVVAAQTAADTIYQIKLDFTGRGNPATRSNMRTLPRFEPARIKELEQAWPRKHDERSRKRLQVIRLAAQHKLNAAQIADATGVSRASVFNYVNRFMEGGVKGLLENHYPAHDRGSVGAKSLEALREQLRQGRFRRGKDAQAWLAGRSIRLALPTVYYWLGKAGGVLKMPRKTHARKDATKAQAFKETLAQNLGEVARGARKVRVWVADEHRYGLLPVMRRCWGLKGVRVHGALCDALPVGLSA